MKLVATLIFLFLMVKLKAQITVKVKDAEPADVIRIIMPQTDLTITGPFELLNNGKKVTMDMTNKGIHEVMTELCKGQCFTFDIIDNKVILKARAASVKDWQQKIKRIYFWGTVINQYNEPVAGIVVVEPESHETKVTNSLGKFLLKNVKPNAAITLTGHNIDSISYRLRGKTEETIKVKENNVTLDTVEVVYTGYQKAPKKILTGSFFITTEQALQQRVSPYITERLEGIVPSLLMITNKVPGINQSTYFTLGGRATLYANPDPLIIVDNFPYEGSLADINPDDIESITFLRDASAASIWGARAGNGVLVITTKSGKYNRPLRVSFNTFFTIGEKPDLFYEDAMSSSNRIWVDTFLFNRNYFRQLEKNPFRPALSEVVEALYNKNMPDAERKALFDSLSELDSRYDQEKHFYRNSTLKHFGAQLSGGTRRNAYSLSLGYDYGLPELRLSKRVRKTLAVSDSYRLLPGLEFSGALWYSESIVHNMDGTPVIPAPYAQLVDANGDTLSHPYLRRYSYIDTAGGDKLLNWKYYPLKEFNLRNRTTHETGTRIQATIKYTNFPGFLKGLEASVFTQYQKAETSINDIKDKESFYVRDLVNSYSQIKPTGVFRPIPWGNILDVINSKVTTNNIRYLLTYNKKWGIDHSLTIITGKDRIRTKGNFTSNRIYGYSENNPVGEKMDFISNFPLYYNQDANDVIPYEPFGKATVTFYSSHFANANYQFKSRYFFSASGRIDKSNLYGAETNNKKIPLLSGGFAWDISTEPFYRLRWLPALKLRLTYGSSGNTPKDPIAIQTFSFTGTNYNGDPVGGINNPPLPTLRWEKVTTLNTGFNFQVVNNMLSGSLDWYLKKGRDLIGFRPIDPSTGNRYLTGNVAETVAQNVDLVLTTKNINREFQWRSTLLFSYVKDYVTKTEDTLKEAWEYCEQSFFHIVPDKPLYGIYSFVYGGLDNNGNPLTREKTTDYASTVQATGYSSLKFHGRSTPSIFGNLTNEFSWKQFHLNVSVIYKFGYFFRRPSVNYFNMFNGTSKGSSDFEERWKKPGDELITNVPSIVFPPAKNRDLFYTYSDVLVERGDHIRLQNIQLNFDLERRALKKLHLQMANIYLNLSDIGILWRANDRKIDPDKLSGYPQTRMLSFGIRGTFK